MATSQNIEDMKLPELKELAKHMGLRGTSTMRKSTLVATLQAARSGGEAPAGVSVRVPKTAPVAANTSTNASPTTGATTVTKAMGDVPAASSSPFAGAHAGAMGTVSAGKSAAATSADRTPFEAPGDGNERRTRTEQPSAERGRSHVGDRSGARRRNDRRDRDDRHDEGTEANLLDELHIDVPATDEGGSTRIRRREGGHSMDRDQPRRRRRIEAAHAGSESGTRDLSDILAALPVEHDGDDAHDEQEGQERQPREFNRRNRNRDHERGERGDDRHQRRGRGRDRDYNNRDNRDNREDRDERDMRDERRDNRREEKSEDVVPVAGIVDVLDSYAFVRTSGYLPGPNDVYVSMGQVKRYGLRKGDAVHGSIRTPREGERRNQRQKFVPLQSIDTINGMSVEDSSARPHFSKLTPLYPQERLKQETTPNKIIGRLIDIIAPIGKGQRGLIVSPPKAGKTITLQNIANAIATNNPEVHLMVVLVDERPEEVTDMERTVQGEVISSTFDRPASDHTTVAELAIERAKRLVELGQDVVVLLDSMTRLARAYNISAPASGRILSGGVDAQALYPPKRFFGAARNIENGGSLTIISSALVETGSKMDEVIFEEFKGTGNMELRLSRELADKRLFPAVDINASGTRREELITPNDELMIVYRLRRLLGGLEPEQAYQTLVSRLKKAPTNRDFLGTIVQPTNMKMN
ncbi:transcription termination factor Rho [Bifidobacterium mongoliense]|uniref:transcription termination factor Rho n=1 Tax=Bifidobacterium mongoliense TaxID=518643 RepID=UPI0030EBB6EE